jgi:iron complex transport system substrate-binding protein
MRLSALIIALSLGACGDPAPHEGGESEASEGEAQRIISLDYCADQYVLKLAERETILALSPLAESDVSYLRKKAQGIPTVRASAEDILIHKPDVVVRSYGGGPYITEFLERAGIEVVQIGYSADVAGVKRVLREVGQALGQEKQARQTIKAMQTRLDDLSPGSSEPQALYITPGGVTAGPRTVIDAMFARAGLENFQKAPGWQALPLERLVYEKPEIVAAGFFDSEATPIASWSPTQHPIARRVLAEQPVVALQAAWLSCSAWYMLDAIEALAEARTASVVTSR